MTPLPETPYVGLTPFGERDAPFYFGRERERRLLGASILSSRLTLLYGASGVGKSSLVRAGLVADFGARARSAVEQGLAPESVLVICSGWRDDPLRALAEAIEASVRDQLGDLAPAPPPFTPRLEVLLAEWLRRLDESAAALAPDDDEPPRSELLLVLDQFEEYFLYHPDEDGEGTLAFELPRAVMREDLRVAFLVSIREDAYTQLDRFEGRIRNLFGSNFRLEHLDEPAARRAIEGPVERYNELSPNGNGGYAVEPELVDAVLEQVRAGSIALGQTGAGAVETDGQADLRVATPFLQLVMTRLWEEERGAGSQTMRAATLERLGGAERLVRSHLDHALAEFDERARELTASVFHQLVTPSGTKIVHTVPDLAEYAEAPEPELVEVLEALAAARILRPVDPAPGETSPRFEIFHDVLAPAILDWRATHVEARAREQAEAEAAEQTAKARRRARIWAGVGIASLVLTVGVGILAYDSVQQRREADQARDAAQGARSLARAEALLPVDPHNAIKSALAALDPEPTKEAASTLRESLSQSRLRFVHTGKQALSEVAVSPAGDWVLSAGAEGAARLINPSSGAVVPLKGHTSNVLAAAFDAHGERAVTADEDGVAFVWDVPTGERVADLRGHSDQILAAAFSPAEPVVATASFDGTARIWDARNGRIRAVLKGHGEDSALTALAFSPDGDLVATADWDGGVRLWQHSRGAPRSLVGDDPHKDWINSLSFSEDGRRLVSASDDQSAGVWNVQTGELIHDLVDHEDWVLDAAFGRDEAMLATIAGKTLRLWDEGGNESHEISVSTDVLYDVEFRRDGRLVLAAGADGVARVWNAATGGLLFELRGHTGAVNSATFTRDGRRVVTVSEDGSTRVWDATSGVELRGIRDGAHDAVFADGDSVAYSVSGNGLEKWDTSSGKRLWKAPKRSSEDDTVNAAAVTAGGKFVVTVGDSGEGVVWDAESGEVISPLYDDESELFQYTDAAVAAHPTDEGRVATAGTDGEAFVWEWKGDTATIRRALAIDADADEPSAHENGVDAIAYSPDGERLATGGEDDTARIWDEETGRLLTTLKGHRGAVRAVAFHPSGAVVATASEDSTVRVWRLGPEKEQTEATQLPGAGGRLNAVAFNHDGSLIAAGGTAGRTYVWAWPSGELVAVLKTHADQINSIAFAGDGRILSAGDDHVSRIYRCPSCGPLADVVRLARERIAAVG